jgi:energy-coupling factor transporter transmembrane protein EcfT
MEGIMNKRIGFLILFIILSVLTMSYLYFALTDYVFVRDINPYFTILFTVVITSLIIFRKINDIKYAKRFKLTLTSFYFLLVILLIVFNWTKPKYTFEKAQDIIKNKEQVTIIDNNIGQKTIPDINNNNLYLITALKEQKEIYYTFDPYNGEFFLLER